MNMPAPRSWDMHAPSHFRLPGYGGAAVFLRGQALPARRAGTDAPVLAFDVMLLSPEVHTWYLSRPASAGFVDRLAAFLFASADDYHPEVSVPVLEDAAMGLSLSVVSSTDSRVGLEIMVVEDPDASVIEHDGLDFETSRATLAACAQAVRGLDGSWPDVGEFDEEIFS
jgi:hypothetical protein